MNKPAWGRQLRVQFTKMTDVNVNASVGSDAFQFSITAFDAFF